MSRIERGGATQLAVPDGDPEAVRAAARRLREVAGRALATAGVRGDAAAELSLVWSGDAATMATTELATLSTRARAVLPHFDAAGAVLASYADALEHTIRGCVALRNQLTEAHAQHARTLAAARTTAPADPIGSAAATARADQHLAEQVATTRRRYGSLMDEFMSAGARCARTLATLTATAAPRAGADEATQGLIGDLPLIRQQLAATAVQPVGRTTPRREQGWFETAVENTADAAAWTFNHTAVPLVNGAANVAEAAIEHPEDLAQMALGAGMMVVGGGGQVGGVALDATGVGAVAGVPLHLAAAGLISAGAATAAKGAGDLASHAAQKDNWLLKEVELKTGSRGHGGDPLPDSLRPSTAGAGWKGRIANNGNGEVWQTPEHVAASIGTTSCKSCVRIMEPKQGYAHGYVKFYNKHGQALRPDGRPGDQSDTHLAIRPDGTYDIPKGWSP